MTPLLLYAGCVLVALFVLFFLRLVYQAIFHPLHIVFDLDHTVLCSVTPLTDGIARTGSRTDDYYFDQVDDDFPFDPQNPQPNTRTFWRPGARALIRLCHILGQQLYIFTAAQGTYTQNILDHWPDSASLLFVKILHRDLVPHFDHDRQSTPGKDLTRLFLEDVRTTTSSATSDTDKQQKSSSSTTSNWPETRTILLDDRITNFIPQPRNGLHVRPYEIRQQSSSISTNGGCSSFQLVDWEILRWTGIFVLCLAASDVRTVLRYFQSADHRDYLFPHGPA